VGTFAKWLVTEMQRQELNQSRLAKKAGLSRATVKLIVDQSTQKPEPDTLGKLAHALDLPVEDLMRRAGYLPSRDAIEDNTTMARLIQVASDLPDDELEELLYIALGKRDKRRK